MSKEFEELLRVLNEELKDIKVEVVNPEKLSEFQNKVCELSVKIS